MTMPQARNDAREIERRVKERARQIEGGNAPKPTTVAEVHYTHEELENKLRKKNERGDADIVQEFFKGRYIYDRSRQEAFRHIAGSHYKKDDKGQMYGDANTHLNEVWGRFEKDLLSIYNDPTTPESELKMAKILLNMVKRRIIAINSRSRMKNIMQFVIEGNNGIAITSDDWNSDPWLLPVRNGVYNLKTFTFRLSTPDDLFCKFAPTDFIDGAEAPHFTAFLLSSLDGKPDLVRYVQKVLGSAIVGHSKQQEFYVFYGEGRNGKGTTFETVKDVMGPLVDPIRSELITESRFEGNSKGADPELLDMQGLRIVWASETKQGAKLNIEKIKRFTGADTLKGRLNYSNEIVSFQPSHTLLLLTNHKPRVGSNEYALWQRLRLIPFLLSFVDNPTQPHERKRDVDLPERLLTERSGILNWLIEGCRLWQLEGLEPPAEVTAATDDYQSAEDLAQAFLDARCEVASWASVGAGELHEEFTSWFQSEFGAKARVPGLRPFGEMLERKIRREKGRTTRWIGIRIKPA
ncbi:DNA primase family protein [Solidesulfovibrio sp.]